MVATVVVFAKAPVRGTVKTRLAATVGPGAALDFYRRTLTTVLTRLSSEPGWRLEIAVTPDDAALDETHWPAGIPRRPQGHGDLGERMARALAAARPHRPVLVVGSDVPNLEVLHVQRACVALATHDLVFGPAEDGGFWLIGARKPLPPGLFHGVRWSSEHALSDTLRNAVDLTVALVDELEDVDDYAAYCRLRERAGAQS